MITLIVVKNPFQPALCREVHEIPWRDGMSLSEALAVVGVAAARHSCVIDGLAIPSPMFAAFTPADGATVICVPDVAGGSFGRIFSEIALVVGIAALAVTGAGAAIGGTLASMLSLSPAAVSAVTSGLYAGIALGGGMLINAFSGSGGGSSNRSSSWDPTGPKTVASGGAVIPKGYGLVRSGGQIIASYVDAEGQDNYLNVLVCYGWGPARSISDIRINNNDIADFKDVVYMTRLGTNDQTPIPYFNNIKNGYPQAVRCNAGEPVVITGTGTQTQGLEVVCQFPDGVFYQNDDGTLRSLTISYKVEYAISGTGDWKTLIVPHNTTDVPRFLSGGTLAYPGWVVIPTDTKFSSGCVYAYDNDLSPTAHTPGDPWTGTQTVTYYNADGSSYSGSITLQGEWQPYDPNLEQQVVLDWSSGYEIFSAADQGTLYHTTKIYNLPPNKYDVRVTKYGSAFSGDTLRPLEANNDRTGDQVWIHSINEVQYQDLAYPNQILLGVRALATDQLSGSNLTVTSLVDYGIGAVPPLELAGFALSNPAVVAYDILAATLYGGGVNPAQIDIPAFVAWAEMCDETVSDGAGGTIKRHVFNGIFDQEGTNLWRSLQKVAMMSNAAIVQVGRTYTVVLDKAVDVPVQVFNVGNIIRDSMADTWLSVDDRANRIEVEFPDAARDYRTDEPCAVMLPADIQAGVEPKTTRIQLLGCTSRAQAWHWAYRKLLSTDLLLLTRKFDVGIEAIACQVGSVIGVQEDVTGWCDGGRIQAASTTTSLVVDRDDLTFAAGEGWTVSVLHPVVQRGTGTVAAVVDNVITLSGALPTGRMVSVENAAGKMGVIRATGTSTGGGVTVGTVTLEDATGFASGQSVAFYDQDVIDTQPVSSVTGGVVVPSNPFIQAPTEGCPWFYGQSAGSFPAKLFTVTSIDAQQSRGRATISCIEYNPAVYADDTPIITDTLGVPSVDAAVTNLAAVEQYGLANGANGGQGSQVSVSWQNGPNTAAVQIWVARNEVNQPLSAETLVATVVKGSTCTLTYPTGTILQVRAVGIDVRGVTAPFASAPTVTITVQGSGLAPGDVTGFTGNFQIDHTNFTWTAPAGADSYEIRYNADSKNVSWQNATLLWAGTGTSWTDSSVRGGAYLIKALSAAPDDVESINAAAFSLQMSSSYLNTLGIAPGQSIGCTVTTNSYDATTGKCSLTLSFAAQTLTRADGTTFNLPAQTLSWVTVLDPVTTYYIYVRVRISDMTVHSTVGDPPGIPDTLPNPTAAILSTADGYFQGPAVTITTPASSGSGGTLSGGGTGGSFTCPDGREIVRTLERGDVPIATVVQGEHVLGRGPRGDVWKLVVVARHAKASTWYRVRGYRVSPLHPVWHEGSWRFPYEIGTIDIGEGTRVRITLDEDEYDEQNFYLVGRGDPLIMHNWRMPSESSEPC